METKIMKGGLTMTNSYGKDMKESYKYYVNYCKLHKKPVYVFEEYKKIVYRYLEYMRDNIFETGYWKLPRKFGHLEIVGRDLSSLKRKNGKLPFKIDVKKTMELWARDEDAKKKRLKVYFLNDHSNGRYYTIRWNTTNYVIGNKDLYMLHPCRTFKRMLAKKIKEGKEYEVK